jgi:hypothetical protein
LIGIARVAPRRSLAVNKVGKVPPGSPCDGNDNVLRRLAGAQRVGDRVGAQHPVYRSPPGTSMDRIIAFVLRELREAAVPFAFFLVVFMIARVSRTLTLEEYHVTLGGTAVAVVGALIVAKAILVADALPLTRRFEHRPLAYSILWKTVVYYVITVVFHYLEEVIPFIRKAGGVAAGNHAMMAEVSWPHVGALQLWIFFSVLLYCFGAELIRAIGPARVKALLFDERANE